jgi:hypothetical protein
MATEQDATEPEDMKIRQIISFIVGITSVALSPITWAEPHGGGGGSGGATFGGGHFSGGGGFRSAGPGFSGRPGYYYSRGMHFTNSRFGQFRSPVSRSSSFARPNRGITNSATGQSRTSGRSPLTSRMGHIAERHNANWHQDWDRRHAHFFHNRFFVFDDGFWFGLDAGFFPWDYYPYYAYDYYPYDYYPGYYADADPYYYSEGGYSSTPVSDPTVTAAQTQLAQLGYYNGPVDGIFGPLTRDAVAKYQIAKHLDVTGSLSAQTLQSFGLPQPTAS